jgi:uncharacterized Zn finger protein
MARESVPAKARRLLAEARLTIRRVDGPVIAAECRGDSASVYRLGYDRGRWYCGCPAVGRCSHVAALMLVTLTPTYDSANGKA